MSQKLVSRNADLSQLRADGYDVSVNTSNYLVIRDVPYVNGKKEVKRGTLVAALGLAGEQTVMQTTDTAHVAFFVGDPPCGIDGTELPGLSKNVNHQLGEGLVPNHQLSRKPTETKKYHDYYHKMKTYIEVISSPAMAIDPKVTAKTHPVAVPDADEDSLFHYIDTGATNNGIVEANKRLANGKIAIVGVGGTGSYVLDLVAKTPVLEIHLFDHDLFLNHNAFRCPGAASLEDLNKKQAKVDYLAAQYARMRKNIFPHNCLIDDNTVEQLKDMTFVFLCIDKGTAKKLIVERLEGWGLPFIDAGMGIQLGDDNTLAGTITVTSSTPEKRDHFRNRVALVDGQAENDYSRNVQIADLSALNAALAVIKWKKMCGYYADSSKEHFTTYTVRSNLTTAEDKHGA